MVEFVQNLKISKTALIRKSANRLELNIDNTFNVEGLCKEKGLDKVILQKNNATLFLDGPSYLCIIL